jgi:hypothetical protein
MISRTIVFVKCSIGTMKMPLLSGIALMGLFGALPRGPRPHGMSCNIRMISALRSLLGIAVDGIALFAPGTAAPI